MAYRQVPHTADIALEIESPDAQGLLACCVSAVSQLLIGTVQSHPKKGCIRGGQNR